ncbi:DUF6394 family protein [Mariprofundus ferrooxydans]|uniref:Uncharacterized protein n=1 Tax=Mariprofundus ferrooxydans PV-1 TaxID=314345 RepID=Q0F046_9PROT|nr:DUF6394 family protein [Mariprofundus ferrooxydans]EAU54838.1 hypothetical protein SPV1_09093 [Mariprofundus ferrooxydans PV-1]KON46365.1 hypothetical protein AL013_13640 [Mariprofundus ferrooxydans]
MSLQRVFFAFFVLLALSMNFGFFYGQIDNAIHHNLYELFGAIVINLIATILKLGERSHFGSLMLASSLVADAGLLAAAMVLGYANHVSGNVTPEFVAVAVSLSGGALVANIVSVTLMVIEAATLRR